MAERAHGQRRGCSPPSARMPASAHVLCGDALDVLATLPHGFAQTCVTSPPYWGLRDYGVPPRVWGGDPGCRHRWGAGERGRRSDLLPSEQSRSVGRLGRDERQGAAGLQGGRFCRRCGAWKGCLGLEPDPDLYVSHLVAVMREVRRVLRSDGTLWLVLGDSFAAGRSYQVRDAKRGEPGGALPARVPSGLKPKDLIGIPWRVAFALQADGWWLRSDIVWAKPNVMPESVTDRPTRAHELVFLLAPSRRYFYDAEAVREGDQGRRSGNGFIRPERLSYGGAEEARGQEFEWVGGAGRNRRSVWTVPTQCFKGAHFATFPEALIEPCVLAGSSPAACRVCGAPWRRIVDARRLLDGRHEIKGSWTESRRRGSSGRAILPTGVGHWRVEVRRQTVGWEASCEHDAPGARCTVLDPFAGAATAGIVAQRHGRDFLGVELSGRYARMARSRLREARR
ncbi:MAG TPA: site-specific DNA-methyltransferase [Solirubrobacterales bacterium]|nr:site-specific DNA-methyltransferase [Solirubrobacterales bacterium]